MADVNAIRDANRVTVLLGVDDVTGETRPILVDADGKVLISATFSGDIGPADSLILEETGAGTDTITLQAPASIAASYTLTLPDTDGDSGQVLTTDGSGVLSWSAGAVPTTITVANEATDTSCFIAFFTAATGDLGPKTNAGLTFNSNTGVLTATGFAGSLTGNVTGNLTGDVTGNVSGNAGTVTGFDPAGGSLTLAGADALTLTTSAATNVTLPTTGTLATLAGTEELDNKTLDSSVGKGTWTASGTWTLPAMTFGGAVTLSENVSLVLDPTLSADGTYCGITEIGTGGTTIAFGDVIYLAAADSRWELADASSVTTAGNVKIGIAVSTSTDGNPVTVLLFGKIRADAVFPALTVSAPSFISETAGDITETQPTTTDAVIRIVGHGQDGNTLWWAPSADYMTHI